jgi:hypothetical protein
MECLFTRFDDLCLTVDRSKPSSIIVI